MPDVASPEKDGLDDLERLVEALPAACEASRFGAGLGRVGAWLDQQRQAIDDVLALSGACGDLRGAASQAARDSVRADLEAIADFGDALEGARDEATLDEVIEMFGAVKAKVTHLDRTLREACSALVKSDFAPLRAVGDLFKDLQPNSDLGRRLAHLADDAARLHERPAATFAPSIRTATTKAQEARAEVALLVGDPVRKAFMDALLAGGATLDQVTPDILEWLATLQALSRFEVKPQGAAR